MNKGYLVAMLVVVGTAAWIGSGSLGDPGGHGPGGTGTTGTGTGGTGTGGEAGSPGDSGSAPSALVVAQAGQSQDPAASAPASPRPAVIEPMRVRVRSIVPEERLARLVAQGRTRADRVVEVKAETAGRVASVAAAKGDRVNAGQGIVQLAEEDRSERLAEARALISRREVEHKAASALEQQAYASRVRLEEARADLEAARARLAEARLALDRTRITAPFAGLVEARAVEVGDYLAVGDPVATLVDLDPAVVVTQVSEREVGSIALGASASATLITGREVSGTVTFIARTAAAETRTFAVEVAIANADATIPAGMTAEVHLPLQREHIHTLPASALTLDDAGRIGVKVVTDSGLVAFTPVTISGEGPAGLVTKGLEGTATVITVGQEFVKVGQPVIPVPEPVPDSTPLAVPGSGAHDATPAHLPAGTVPAGPGPAAGLGAS